MRASADDGCAVLGPGFGFMMEMKKPPEGGGSGYFDLLHFLIAIVSVGASTNPTNFMMCVENGAAHPFGLYASTSLPGSAYSLETV